MKWPVVVLCACLLSACSGESPTELREGTVPPTAAAISDGSVEGNPHFFFLAPMVRDPHTEGVFDGTQRPSVEICVWNGAGCTAPIELFSMDGGPGSETIRVDTESERYIVNWHTKGVLSRFPLGEGESYRIRVFVGLQMLGYADVQVVSRGGALRTVDTSEYIGLKDGRTLPITFRIEEGFEADLEITTSSLPRGMVGLEYEASMGASGGSPPYRWSLAEDSRLPPGISFSSDGVFDGVPEAPDAYEVSVRVRDSGGASAVEMFTIVIDALTPGPTILTSSLPDAYVGEAYSSQLEVVDGLEPLRFDISEGALPPGLELDQSGRILGVPESVSDGPVSFTVRVTDRFNRIDEKPLTLQVILRPTDR